MGNHTSTCYDEVVFLKSTSAVIDVNLQGAYSLFIICRSSELDDGKPVGLTKSICPSSVEAYNSVKCTWDKLSIKTWARMAKWARDHHVQPSNEDDTDEDAKNNKHCEAYIFDANKVAELRTQLKDDKNGVGKQSIILVSLVVTTVNIEGWIDNQKDTVAGPKAVKVTKKERVCADKTTIRRYERMFARSCSSGLTSMLSGSGAQIGYHTAMTQIDTPEDMHIAITGCNAIMVDRVEGTIREGSFKKGKDAKEQLMCLIKEAEGGAAVMGEIREILDTVCDKTSKHESRGCNDRFVCLVGDAKCGAAKVTVQCMSSLNEDVRERIIEAKAELPSTVNPGARVRGAQGSMFKHANCVYLATADFNGKHADPSITCTLYE